MLKVPDFLLKDEARELNNKLNNNTLYGSIGKTPLERKVVNLASFLKNDYPKLYDLGVSFDIDINYLDEDVNETYDGMTRYEMICHMLEKYGTGILTMPDGTKYKCYDARQLYDICSDFNQRNKRFKLAAARRKAKEGKDFRLYNAENVWVVYKGSGYKIRKLKK